MNKNIMYHKVGHTISKYSKSNWKSGPKAIVLPANETANTHCGIKDKEEIVTLPPTPVIFEVMVFVDLPHKAVHHILMREPRHKFHDGKGG